MSSVHDFNYYYQIQGNLHFTNRNVCDLIVWCPKSMHVIRIYRNDPWLSNVPILFNFYRNIYMPKYMQNGVDAQEMRGFFAVTYVLNSCSFCLPLYCTCKAT